MAKTRGPGLRMRWTDVDRQDARCEALRGGPGPLTVYELTRLDVPESPAWSGGTGR